MAPRTRITYEEFEMVALPEDVPEHGVHAIDAEKNLEGLKDEDVLELAISEDRVLITANVGDFLPLLTALGETGRSHPGCIFVPRSFRNEDFGPLISTLDRRATERPAQGLDGPCWMDQEALGTAIRPAS